MKRYTAAEVADALTASRGMVTHAALRLGCSRRTVYNYIEKYATVEEALDDARAALGDRIESTLLHEALGTQNKNGTYSKEPNIAALIFLAKTHPAMRERGYVEKQQLEHSGNLTWSQFIAQAQDDDSD